MNYNEIAAQPLTPSFGKTKRKIFYKELLKARNKYRTKLF